jgi:hypothetical protein
MTPAPIGDDEPDGHDNHAVPRQRSFPMNEQVGIHEREVALLREIGAISDRVREMRRPDGHLDGAQIKALEAQSRAKWEELRLLRAGPVTAELTSPRRRGLYI